MKNSICIALAVAAAGIGMLDGAQIVEFGRHDIVPGVAGDPSGYLGATKGDGNVAYIKWTVRAVFLPGKDGKARDQRQRLLGGRLRHRIVQGPQGRWHPAHQVGQPHRPHLHP